MARPQYQDMAAAENGWKEVNTADFSPLDFGGRPRVTTASVTGDYRRR